MLLQIEHLSKDYPTRSGSLSVLSDVNLEFQRGEAVARALINRPVLLLADEPTGNLDRHTARDVIELLLELHRDQQTILIVVTHSAELAGLFPRRLEMLDGTLRPAGGTA